MPSLQLFLYLLSAHSAVGECLGSQLAVMKHIPFGHDGVSIDWMLMFFANCTHCVQISKQ